MATVQLSRRLVKLILILTIQLTAPINLTSVFTTAANLTLSLQGPHDVMVSRGQPATLRCNYTNTENGIVQVTWFHDGVPVVEDARRSVLPDGSLHIKKVAGKRLKPLDGSYRCMVKNGKGAALSPSARLRIAMLAHEFLQEPNDTSVHSKQPVVLLCRIQSIPEAVIQWKRDDKVLPQSIRYVPLPSGALFITAAQFSDSGTYSCVASNKMIYKTQYSRTAKLTVLPELRPGTGPAFIQLDTGRNYTVKVGADVDLYCAATGSPVPVIQWFFDGIEIGNSNTLHLQNVSTMQAGTYKCSASNEAGQIFQDYNVTVLLPPYFIKPPKSELFPLSKSVKLPCEAGGVPPPTITWLKNGKPLVFKDRTMYLSNIVVIAQTFSSDSGLYQCVARNAAGELFASAQLEAIVKDGGPDPPANLRCRPVNLTKICIEFDVPLPSNNPQPMAYSGFYTSGAGMGGDFVPTNRSKLVTNLNPNTSYTFYIRSYTNAASDSYSNVTCQTVLPEKRKLTLKPINGSTLLADWTVLKSDVPCGSTESPQYRLQWSKYGHSSYSRNSVELGINFYTIMGLIPKQKYEVKVELVRGDDNEVTTAVVEMPEGSEVQTVIDEENVTDIFVLTPIQLEAECNSSSSARLIWSDRNPLENLTSYVVCYKEHKLRNKCNKEITISNKDATTAEVQNLKPFTVYEFKVRGLNSKGRYSQYSNSAECWTSEGVPSAVPGVGYKIQNTSSICIFWGTPNPPNGEILSYIISYTANQSYPLERWRNVTVPASKHSEIKFFQPCTQTAENSASILLNRFSELKKYAVVVRAKTSAGLSQASNIIFLTPDVLNHKQEHNTTPFANNPDDFQFNQKLGIIVGVIISLLCVVACVSCMVFQRRCVKARSLARGLRSRNGQEPRVAYSSTPAQHSACQPVGSDQSCLSDTYEMERLVPNKSTVVAHIPPIENAQLDTKGGANFPNGQVNGLKQPILMNGHIANGHVHITENPRYEACECNGDAKLHLESRRLLDTSLEPCCDPDDRMSSNGDSSNDQSLNVTQLTSLDNSLSLVSPRRISPALGPNG